MFDGLHAQTFENHLHPVLFHLWFLAIQSFILRQLNKCPRNLRFIQFVPAALMNSLPGDLRILGKPPAEKHKEAAELYHDRLIPPLHHPSHGGHGCLDRMNSLLPV